MIIDRTTPLVTVIIPLYNVANYIARCLDSVLAQTYGNLEILLINDGSTDDTGHICDEYSTRDSRVRVVQKENEGVGKARNTGIDIALGDWIAFIDGDDYVVPEYIENLLNAAVSSDCKMSCCNMIFKFNGEFIKQNLFTNPKILTSTSIMERYFDDEIIKCQFYGPVNKLIHKSLFEKIRFMPYAVGEDVLFIYMLLQNIDTVAITPLIGYHYIKRENSATTSTFNLKKLDYVKAAHEILFCSGSVSSTIYDRALKWTLKHSITTLRQIYRNRMELQCLHFVHGEIDFLNKHKAQVSQLGVKRRMDYVLLRITPQLFRILPI